MIDPLRNASNFFLTFYACLPSYFRLFLELVLLLFAIRFILGLLTK